MSKFVPRFRFPDYNIPRTDFKGHQLKALKRFNDLAPQLNLILELRDVRAPLSTRNVLIDQLIDPRIHQRLVVYTKRDLVAGNTDYLARLAHWQHEIDEQYILLDAKKGHPARRVLEIIRSYKRQHEARNRGLSLPTGYRVLVTGMPNVGKSTLINTLRGTHGGAQRRKVARTGAEAGVTRSTSECIRIGDPADNVYLIDTPGIGLPARLAGGHARTLARALCGCAKRGLVDPVVQADYLLYLANLQDPGRHYPGPPTNDVHALLRRVAPPRSPTAGDTAAAVHWLAAPRRGLVFDRELLLAADAFSMRGYLAHQLQPQPQPQPQNNARLVRRDAPLPKPSGR